MRGLARAALLGGSLVDLPAPAFRRALGELGDGDGGGGPIDGGGPFDIPFPGEDEEEVIEPLPDEEDVVDDDEEEDEDEDPFIG